MKVPSMDWPTGKNVLNVIAIMNVCLLEKAVFVAITFVLNGAHLAIVPLVLVVPLQNLLLLRCSSSRPGGRAGGFRPLRRLRWLHVGVAA